MTDLYPSYAADAAAALFSLRTGAVNFLQIAGMQKEFAAALKDSAEEAEVSSLNAAGFENFLTTIGRFEGRVHMSDQTIRTVFSQRPWQQMEVPLGWEIWPWPLSGRTTTEPATR